MRVPTGESAWIVSLIYVSYAFTGWNGAAYIAGEVGNPGRTLPRAILIGTGLVILLYILLNIAFLVGLPLAEARAIAATDREALEPVAELAARHLFGPRWGARLAWLATLVLIGSLSAMLVTGPRVARAMAGDGLFPAAAARLSRDGGTPSVATAIVVFLALVLLWSGSFEWLVVFSGIGLALFSLATVAAVLVLRHSRPDLDRPFRVPLYPWPPLLYLAGTGGLLVITVIRRPGPSTAAALAILLGLPLHEWLSRGRAGLPPPQAGA